MCNLPVPARLKMSPYERDQDAEAEKLERAGIGLVVLFAFAGSVAVACQPAEAAAPIGLEGAAYRMELAECRERSSTCLGYVACRRRVETAHGRAYAGRCEP